MSMDTSEQSTVLIEALRYIGYGWAVVPLHWCLPMGGCSCTRGKDCPTPGKHPWGKGWQENALTTAEAVEAFWEKHPRANVGILLGPKSKIIDIEVDSEEEERIYLWLCDGNPPVTPTFQSSRGKHRLFRWRADLPGGAILAVGALKIRVGNGGAGAMSVFPPSFHHSGTTYKWLVHPEDCEIADLTETMLARLVNASGEERPHVEVKERRSPEHWEKIFDGVGKGDRNDSMCSLAGFVLSNIANLEDKQALAIQYRLLVAQNERNNPPLPEEEVRTIFNSVLKAERLQRTQQEYGKALPIPAKIEEPTKPKTINGYRLVIVASDPPMYELYHDAFAKGGNGRGCIVLSAEQLTSPRKIKIEALRQAEYPLPREFSAAWDGRGKGKASLYQELLFSCDHRDAPPEEKRPSVIAQQLVVVLDRARDLEEGQKPTTRRACRLKDGSIVFAFTPVLEELSRGTDKITRIELSRVLQMVDVQFYQKRRLKRLTAEGLTKLNLLAVGGSNSDEVNE